MADILLVLISLCCFSFSFFENLSLMHAGDFQRRLLLLLLHHIRVYMHHVCLFQSISDLSTQSDSHEIGHMLG